MAETAVIVTSSKQSGQRAATIPWQWIAGNFSFAKQRLNYAAGGNRCSHSN
ncbi:hypothetical protein Mal15_05220 [Stieleria maiorica]|uniref:Uncharacterized protein n=1 Tax=Stieleria maiorica TaxID=2795974 RepID=A0A5B9MAC1_9BACT|nr:hypothetical protein Mal15_05220 [Stieleria maiorica]